jgi:hypothetical protein
LPTAEITNSYVHEVQRLAKAHTTTETSYYPAIKKLLEAILQDLGLTFEVRSGTSEDRLGGGRDQPDIAIYDENGDYVVVSCEVKTSAPEIEGLARSEERNDQIGRYLGLTRVVLLCNVRSFGLLTLLPDTSTGAPVPPAKRLLEQVVNLWPSAEAIERGDIVPATAFAELTELLETALTRFAVLGSPESLAKVLARQARQAKHQLPAEFTRAVSGLAEDFRDALGVSFEGKDGEEFFRSSLIQTVFYGLFAGWTLWVKAGAKREFRWEELTEHLKIPFLGELFYELQHPTRIHELNLRPFLDRATETLSRVDRVGFFSRFQTPTLQRDADGKSVAATAAILYFYEPFLEAFDPKLRKELGVWYTPAEIVQYQVQNIDKMLREQLGCDRGLADENVVILDPCCGTGAYLIEILRTISIQLASEGAGDLLGEKLLDAVRHRLIGFEVLTAPFVIAQLQMYLLLAEAGAPPLEKQRPAVFLTNALTGWDGPDQVKLHFPELQEEHDAAQRVKRGGRIIVVVGNPPYNRFAGVPLEEEADLVDHYKGISRKANGKPNGPSRLYKEWGVKKHLLDDLYIRFFRLAERCIGERAEYGLVSFISNYSFYTGRSHPLMRESLLSAFDSIWIDNLNGDKYKTGKVIPVGLPGAGTSDQSVFSTPQDTRGIQVGTGITTMVKRKGHKGVAPARVYFRNFWGKAQDKRVALLHSLDVTDWSFPEAQAAALTPAGPRPFESFQPTRETRWKLFPFTAQGGFEDWPALDEIFSTSIQGVNHNRGIQGSVVEIDKSILSARMMDYFSNKSTEELQVSHPVLFTPRARYVPGSVRIKVKELTKFQEHRLVPYTIFPLDKRWIYLETEGKLLNEARPELWENLGSNEFLVAVPEPRKYSEIRPLLLTSAYDLHLHDRGSVGFPITVVQRETEGGLFGKADITIIRTANLNRSLWASLKGHWKLNGDLGGGDARDLAMGLARVCLAICHSPAYEIEHKDSLAQDWAHIPIPRQKELFDRLRAAGDQIAVLLNPVVDARNIVKRILGDSAKTLAVASRVGGGSLRSEDLVVAYSFFGNATGGWRSRQPSETETLRTAWGTQTGDLYINGQIFFRNVPSGVWEYELGGYPVIKKWLAYRDNGRRPNTALTLDETEHLRGMIQRIAAILALHEGLSGLYEETIKDCFGNDELSGV